MIKRLKIIPIGGLGEIGKNMTLLQYGFVLRYVPVDKQHRLAGEVPLVSQGFLQMDTSKSLMEKARHKLKRTLKETGCQHQDSIRKNLQDFFYNQTQCRPVILPHVVRV